MTTLILSEARARDPSLNVFKVFRRPTILVRMRVDWCAVSICSVLECSMTIFAQGCLSQAGVSETESAWLPR